MLRLQNLGAHNINFVSPSHIVWSMAEAIQKARQSGLTIPIVYNSNGYEAVQTLRSISGLVDIYLPDLKYRDNGLGNLYSKVSDYADHIEGVLREMLAQVGNLQTDSAGIARSGLLVRHLALPGQFEDSDRCLALLADLSPQIQVSLMSQYAPRFQADRHPPLNRGLSMAEYDRLMDAALSLGLENVFVQELESRDHYLPDFEKEDPFA